MLIIGRTGRHRLAPGALAPHRLARKAAPGHYAAKASRPRWPVLAHTSDVRPLEWSADGFAPNCQGRARLGERAADSATILEQMEGALARLVPGHHRHSGRDETLQTSANGN